MKIYQKMYLKMLQRGEKWSDEHNLLGGRVRHGKTVYIIRRSGMKLGLCSYFNVILGKIVYAYENDMIPVVDMQYFNNSLLLENDFGSKNAWEYFLEQPSGMSLDDAYASKKIVLSDSRADLPVPNDTMSFFNNDDGVLEYWRNQNKKYIRFKKDIVNDMENNMNRLFSKEDRILGVLARGTDYLKLQPTNHPIQPDANMIIDKSKEVMKEKECNKLFLASEDKTLVAKFKKEFGDKLVLNSQVFVDYKDGFLSDINLKDKKTESNLNYLTNIYILSKCNCIVAGRTSGTVTAAVLSDGWEYSYFFDLGYYE